MKLLIATPAINGMICGEYVASLLSTLQYCAQQRILVEWKYLRGVSEISRGRDSFASYALREGFDKIMFIDADQGWTEDAFSRVVSSDKKIIGGTYCKKELPLNLNFGCLPQHNGYFGADKVKTPERFMKWKAETANEKGETEIAFLPTGFMCISCDALEKLKEFAPPYLSRDSAQGEEVRCWEFFPVGVFGGFKDTEDWGFCRFARSCGIPVWLQTRAVADHIGSLNFKMMAELV